MCTVRTNPHSGGGNPTPLSPVRSMWVFFWRGGDGSVGQVCAVLTLPRSGGHLAHGARIRAPAGGGWGRCVLSAPSRIMAVTTPDPRVQCEACGYFLLCAGDSVGKVYAVRTLKPSGGCTRVCEVCCLAVCI